MKKVFLFLVFAFLFSFVSFAQPKNYYISTAGSDANNGLTIGTPWKTIAKINSSWASINAGDSILFKCGEVFTGSIIVGKSGTSGNPIVISSYGTGNKPIITGFTTITTWTAGTPTGVWTAAINAKTSLLNVTMDDIPQRIGRYPNFNNTDGGYLFYEAFSSNTSITDNELTSAIDWTGAEVVIRKYRWVIERNKITSHVGSVITYGNLNATTINGSTSSRYTPSTINYGYFIQNDVRTLDQLGEWHHNQATKTFSFFFGTDAPDGHVVKFSSIDTLINISNKNYITVRNLELTGAGQTAIYAKDGSTNANISIRDCNISQSGAFGVQFWNEGNVLIDNCYITNCLSTGIQNYSPSQSNFTCTNNTVLDNFSFHGMADYGNDGSTMRGITFNINTATVSYNTIKRAGYSGINFGGNNLLIEKNVIDSATYRMDDNAGLYTYTGTAGAYGAPSTINSNRILRNNIIANSLGNGWGTPNPNNNFGNGIYLDGKTNNVDIIDNVIMNTTRAGITMNNPLNVNLRGNILYNDSFGIRISTYRWGNVSNLTIKKNFILPTRPRQIAISYNTDSLKNALGTEVSLIGTIDSNYVQMINPNPYKFESPNPTKEYSLGAWQALTSQDAHTTAIKNYQTYSINGLSANKFTNADFNTNITGLTGTGTGVTVAWDGSSQINGAGSAKAAFTVVTPNTYGLFISPINAVSSVKNYILRFKIKGAVDGAVLRVYIRKSATPFTSLTPIQYSNFGTVTSTKEFLFRAPTTEAAASTVIEIDKSSGTTYIDSLGLFEANINELNTTDSLKFFYNKTNSNITNNLSYKYTEVNTGTDYDNSIVVSPFTGRVLTYKSASDISIPVVSSSYTPILCNGDSTNIIISATGGVAPLTGTGTFRKPAGTYTFVVTDANLISDSVTVTLTQPSVLVGSSSFTPILCNGGTSTVTISAHGGNSPYTGTGSFTQSAGTTNYTITDFNGCTKVVAVTITQPTALNGSVSSGTILINGNTTTLTVTPSGGTSPYTYNLNGGTYQSGNTFTNQPAGTYSINIKDANNCIVNKSITVTQPAVLVASSSIGTILCNGGNTSVVISATGGVTPYTGTGTFTNVTAGNYNYTVTDANGATSIASVSVTQPSVLTSVVNTGTITVNGGSTNATVIASGATPPYTYNIDGGTFQSSNTFSGVLAGSHTIIIKDVNNCSNTKNFTLTQPTLLVASSSATSILCNGGTSTVTVSASGGVPPYTGTGTFVVNAGSYNYVVTDANSVTKTTAITVTQPTVLNSSLSYSSFTNVITVTASGGTPTYTYNINSGSYQGGNTFTISSFGTYTINVKDANSCITTKSITVSQPLAITATPGTILCNGGTASVVIGGTGGTAPYTGTGTFTQSVGTVSYTITDANNVSVSTSVTLTQPAILTSTVSSGTILVNGGNTSISVVASGGTSPYTYNIDGGTYQSSNTFTNVVAGTYSINIKDANNCIINKSITITQPTLLVASSSAGSILCNGGTTNVTVSATGGVSPYTGTGTFTVSAGSYTYTVTDANGVIKTTSVTITQPTALTNTLTFSSISNTITVTATGGTTAYTYNINGGSYQSGNTFTIVSSGTYSVNVKDANNCIVNKSITVTLSSALVASSSATSILCNGDSSTVTVTATGGATPYTGTGTFRVIAGTYTYNITDANSVATSTTITITQPTLLDGTISSGTILVNGGSTSVTVNATGGTSPYTYNIDGGSYQSSNLFTSIIAGSHTVIIKDANNCTVSKNFTITQPTLLVASSSSSTILCNGGTSTITVSASGGVTPYVGTGTFTVNAGTYTFNVTDANGVVKTTSITVTQPTVLNSSLSYSTFSNVITVTASGGVGPYTYNFENNGYQSSNTFIIDTDGTYTIVTKDANNCTNTQNITVVSGTSLSISLDVNTISCYGGTTTITVYGSGGTPPYSGTGSFTVKAGTYTFTITDANDVSTSTTVRVAQNAKVITALTVSNVKLNAKYCDVKITSRGGTGIYLYSLNNSRYKSSNTYTYLVEGSYQLITKDTGGCTYVDTFVLSRKINRDGTYSLYLSLNGGILIRVWTGK